MKIEVGDKVIDLNNGRDAIVIDLYKEEHSNEIYADIEYITGGSKNVKLFPPFFLGGKVHPLLPLLSLSHTSMVFAYIVGSYLLNAKYFLKLMAC